MSRGLFVGTPSLSAVQNRAVNWARSILGAQHLEVVELPGGQSSTVLALTDPDKRESVLRVMTNEPWRSFGRELTLREEAAQKELARWPVPAPVSIAVDPDGQSAGFAAHLMSRLPGVPACAVDDRTVQEMARVLAIIHDVRPRQPFRLYESWAAPEKWTVPTWAQDPDVWQQAFTVLSETPPSYEPTFLHRDYGLHNLLWADGTISGVVDWVETSTGPVWLDVGHAATNLAVSYDLQRAVAFIAAYSAATHREAVPYWLVMDAVGFLPPPGEPPVFSGPRELEQLDRWLQHLIRSI